MHGFRQLYGDLTTLVGIGTISLAARLALAALLAASGVYKIRHPLVAAAAAVNFRVIPHPWKTAGFLLGLTETLVAASLLIPVRPVALAGSVAAGGLATGYVVVTGRALRAGRTFPCHCLPGLVGDVSAATLLRALAMVVAATVGAAGPVLGSTVTAASAVSAAGLAVASIGIPLAVFDAVVAWRSYSRLVKETDWVWVLAARAGQIAAPENRTQEA
jgi:hypothetical protein